jgi:glycosyltransferase involved in cell wall biosynthesis
MSRLRVAVSAVAGVTGGPATYVVELLRAMAALGDPDLDLHILTDRPDLFAASAGVTTHELPLPSSWYQPWWDNIAVPRVLRRLAPDVYHGTKHALPLAFVPRQTAAVVSLHDLAVYAEPETFSLAQRWQLYLHLRHAVHRSGRIIAVSEYTAMDVVRQFGVPRAKIDVVGHGVAESFRPPSDAAARAAVRARYGAAEGRLVAFVGTAQPRKRIGVALDAVAQLVAEGLKVQLVIAGRRRPGYEPEWLRDPPAFVTLAGEVDAAELVELYGAADVMVSPSSFEGFGLTFVEAMACGCPVVGVAATSVPEVVGEGGVLVERPEAGLVATALRELLGDEIRRKEVASRALARARDLSWPRAAARTLEVYRAALA